MSEAAGFATGFDVFEEVETGRRQAELEREDLRGRLAWARDGLRADADDGAGAAEAVLERWLAESREKPFFWFVNLVEAHSPYLPPKPYDDLGPLERMRAADEARRYLNLSAIWRACLTGAVPPADALDRMRHLYARSVRLADDWVGRFLTRLADAGLADDTLVLVTSDHGENFGEEGLMAHAFSLDDRLVNVPFVSSHDLSAPGPLSLADVPALLAGRARHRGSPVARARLPGRTGRRPVGLRGRGRPASGGGRRSVGPNRRAAREAVDPADLRDRRHRQAAGRG